MAPKLILSHQAYLSTILHASKHPHQPVNGVLLGSTSGGSEIVVERAIPLLHHWTTLSPMMEIGLELVRIWCTHRLKALTYRTGVNTRGKQRFTSRWLLSSKSDRSSFSRSWTCWRKDSQQTLRVCSRRCWHTGMFSDLCRPFSSIVRFISTKYDQRHPKIHQVLSYVARSSIWR